MNENPHKAKLTTQLSLNVIPCSSPEILPQKEDKVSISTLLVDFQDSDEEIDNFSSNFRSKSSLSHLSISPVKSRILEGLSPLLNTIKEEEVMSPPEEEEFSPNYFVKDLTLSPIKGPYSQLSSIDSLPSVKRLTQSITNTNNIKDSKLVFRPRRNKKFKPVINYGDSNVVPILIKGLPQ